MLSQSLFMPKPNESVKLCRNSRYLNRIWIPDAAIISPDISLDDIKQYFLSRNTSVVSLFEFGIRFSRLDLIQVDTWKRIIKAYEFKISRGDFLHDTKWQDYLDFCHSLSFACPYGLIDLSELPRDIGLIYIIKWRHEPGHWHNADTWFVKGVWVRKPRRHQIESEMYIEVISLLLNRAKYRQGEFF